MERNGKILEIEKLRFEGVDESDVYNISKSFFVGKDQFIFGRVEPRDNTALSKVFLFRNCGNLWRAETNFAPLENSEDPFITKIQSRLVLGCVEVKNLGKDTERELDYRTVLYSLENLAAPKKIFEGPWQMKDVRFFELNDGKIALFSRPQGGNFGNGKIGFNLIDSLDKIDSSSFENARTLDLFGKDERGGANEVHSLGNGNLFVLGHIAKRNGDSSLFYRPMYFMIDSKTHKFSKPKILFERKSFPPGESKSEKYKDIIFPGGCQENSNGTVDFYVGAGDAEAYRLRLQGSLEEFSHIDFA